MNDSFKITLKPTLEFNKESIQKELNKETVSINVKVNINKEQLQKDLSKIKLDFELNLTKKNINFVNKQIKNLQKDNILNKIKLDFELNLTKKNIQSINKQIRNLTLNKVKLDVDIAPTKNKKIDNINISTPINQTSPSKNDNADITLISRQEKRIDGELTDVTDTYRKNATEIEKVIQKYDEQGNKLEQITENTKEYEKSSKNLYETLKKQNQTLTKLENEKINAIKSGQTDISKYDELINKQKEIIKNTEKEIELIGYKNLKSEDNLSISKQVDELKEQSALYKELEKSLNTLRELELKKDKGLDINAQEYDVVINKQKQIINNIQDTIEARGLVNKELQEQIEQLQRINELAITDKQKIKEQTRQAKFGEIYNTEYTKGLSYESSNKELEEFGRKTFENFEKVTSVKNKVQDLTNAQKHFTIAVKTGKGQVTEYTYAIDKATNNVYQLGEKIRRVNTTIAGSGALLKEMVEKIAQWNIATTLVFQSIEFFKKGIEYIVELDIALTEIALVTGQTRDETEKLKDTYVNLGNETKKTIIEIAKLNTELVRQGLSQEETQNRLDSILKLSAVSGMNTEDTLKIVTSSVNALGEEAKKTADVLVYADNQSASSVESIGKAMAKVSSNAKESELSIEQLVGQIATLIDVTQEAPETLGNALKSMLARFSKVNEIGEFNENLNDVEKAFTRVGISFRDSEGQIRPFYDLMTDMAKIFPTLDKNTKSMVATLSAGTQQQNRFLALIQNWDRVQELTSQLETSSGGALERGYSVWTESLKAELNNLQLAFEKLWLTMVDENVLKVIIRFFSDLTNLIAFFGQAINPAIFSLALFIRLAKKDESRVLDNFLLSIIKSMREMTVETKKQIAVQKILNKENGKTSLSFKSFKNAITGARNELKKSKMSSDAMASAQGTLISSINKSKLAMLGLNLVMSAVWSIGASLIFTSVAKIYDSFVITKQKADDIKSAISDTVNAFKDLSSTHKDNIKTLKELASTFETLNKKVGENYDLGILSTEERQEYLDVMNQIYEIAPEFISHWDNEGNAIIQYGTKIQDIIDLKKELYKLDKQNAVVNFQKQLSDFDGLINSYMRKMENIQSRIMSLNPDVDFNKLDYLQEASLLGQTYGSDVPLQPKIERWQQILTDPSSTDKERARADKEIEKITVKANQLKNEFNVLDAEINKALTPFKEMLNLNISEYFDEIGTSISQVNQDLIKTTTNEFADKLIRTGVDAEKVFFDAQIQARELTDFIGNFSTRFANLKVDNLQYSVDELEQAKQEVKELGLDSNQASTFVDKLSFSILGLGQNSNRTKADINGLAGEISNGFNKIKKWEDLLQKTFSNSVDIDDVLQSMQDYPEIIEKINNGMEINTVLQELALEQIEQENAKIVHNLEVSEQANIQKKQALLEEKKAYEDIITTYEKKGKTETSTYKETQESLNKVIEQIKTVDDETNKNVATIKAYREVSSDLFAKEQFEIMTEQFNSATENIRKYQEMINTINQQGITQNVIKDIIANYPQLLAYIDNEVALRDTLNDLIKSEEDLQKESYKIKLMYSQQFANAFLKLNADMLNQLGNKYNIDLNNFETVQQKKIALLNAMNAQLAKSNARLSADFSTMTSTQLQSELSKREEFVEGKVFPAKNNGSLTSVFSKDTLHSQVGQAKAEIVAIKDMLSLQSQIDKQLDTSVNKVSMPQLNKISTVGVGGGSQGGSSVKAKKTYIDLIKLEKEQYLKLNKELEKNNRLLEKNRQLENYAIGSDKIKIMSEENKILSERQKLLHNLANEYRKEQAELKASISKVIDLGTDEGLSSFPKYMKAKEDEINNLIRKINSSSNDGLSEQKDALEKQVNKFAEEYKRYVEITFNTIPDLQKEYTDLIFDKFDKTVEMMQTKLDKYAKEVGRLNILQKLVITGKRDNTSELERELKIHQEISTIYLNELSTTKKHLDETKAQVDAIEKKLSGIKDKNSSEYKNVNRELILAKNLSDEALKMYEENLEAYADSLNSKVNIEIQLLDKIREKAKQSLQDLRKELNEFSMASFTNEVEKIKLELDRIDKIFIDNPKLSLDTTDTRNQLKDMEKSMQEIRKNTEKWKKQLDAVKNSNKSNKEILKEIDKIAKDLITSENLITEQIEKKNEEILKLELEYQKIENSLQNQIDLKQEEIDKIREEQEHNEKINALISKRLELLRAIDDTSHMYVTGQGEIEWTYDKGKVNSLLEQFAQEEEKDKTEQKISQIQEEIDKMVENLNKTKDIHQQNLAVNQAQLQQLEKEKNYISNLIDQSMSQLDDSFDKMIDQYIDTLNKNFQKNTNTLIDIYNLLKQNVGSKNFNYKSIEKTKTITVGKNEETLEKIAKKYMTTVDKIVKLNTGLLTGQKLLFGQTIQVPSFDTGGYTGTFGKDGRLAMLHEKELVLNKYDTQNLLDIIKITRDMVFNDNLLQKEKNSDDNTIINIHNLQLPNVNDPINFANSLQRIARGGMGRLN